MNKALFTVRSGSNPWSMTYIETDTINEEDVDSWADDCVKHHTGSRITQNEWKLFHTNRQLVRKSGSMNYEFGFEKFTIQ